MMPEMFNVIDLYPHCITATECFVAVKIDSLSGMVELRSTSSGTTYTEAMQTTDVTDGTHWMLGMPRNDVKIFKNFMYIFF
jgi:hypothetical protein